MSMTNQQAQLSSEEIVRGYRPIEAIIPQHWTEATLVANGIGQHFYRTGGGKPPVVLVHGILEGSLSWLRTARALQQDYDVIMPDTRGHGLSAGITTGYTPQQLTSDLAELLRALDLGNACVVGFSQGATTSILLADVHPAQVRALVAAGLPEDIAASGNFDISRSPGYQAWYEGYLSWLESLKSMTHEQRMLSGLSQQRPGAPLPPEDEYVPWIENCARLDLDLVKFSRSLWVELADRVRQQEMALQRITCPALLLKSSFRPALGQPQSVQEEPPLRPNVRVVRFVNTGHLIHHEQFDAFIALIRSFLAANRD